MKKTWLFRVGSSNFICTVMRTPLHTQAEMSGGVNDLIKGILPDISRIEVRLGVISATPTDTYALPAHVLNRVPASWLRPRQVVIYEATDPAKAMMEVLENKMADLVSPQMRISVKAPTAVKQLEAHRMGQNVGYKETRRPKRILTGQRTNITGVQIALK